MQSLMETFREKELVVFSTDGMSVLFSPETLQVFLLTERSAAIVSALLDGKDPLHVAASHNIDPQAIDKLVGKLVSQVESSSLPYSNDVPVPQLHSVLPKLALMVNNFCNLKCSYCYEADTVFTKPATVMPDSVVRVALDKFSNAFQTIKTVMFIGGEATLNPEVIDLACAYASELATNRGQEPPAFCMISNGVKMDDRLWDLIAKYQIQITFSVDGPKRVNDLVRIRHDNTGSFDDVAHNLKRYADRYPDRVGLECTVTAAHKALGMSVKDLLVFAAREFGVKQPHIAAAGLPPGHPLDPYKDGGGQLSREFHDAAEHSVNALLESMTSEQRYDPLNGSLDTISAMYQTVVRREGFIAMCPAGSTQLAVDAFGDVYPCWMFAGMDQFRMGNVLRDEVFNDLAAKVLSRIALNTKKNNPYCSKCYARYACNACIGNNQNATGAIEKMSDAFCNTVRDSLRSVILKLGVARQDPMRWDALLKAAQHAKQSHVAPNKC
jgi:uncharacterized protein